MDMGQPEYMRFFKSRRPLERSKGRTHTPMGKKFDENVGGSQSQCELLLMDMGVSNTQLGPLWILGMPWFREYYTTFDLGPGNKDHRGIYIGHADKECIPNKCYDNGGRGECALGPIELAEK